MSLRSQVVGPSALLVFCVHIYIAGGFTDSGVPCYLRPAGDGCHYHPKPDSPVCTSPADKRRLSEGVRQVNRTLVSLELQLVRLGVIPPDNSCSELPQVANGGVIYSDLNLAPGCTGRYICNEGYTISTLFGRKEFSCTEYGIWNGNFTDVPVECQLNVERCEPPEELRNGNITFKDNDPANILLGDMITYICDPGSVLNGPQYRYCLRNGNWSGEEPHCETSAANSNNNESGPNKGVVIGGSVGGIAGIVTILVVVVVFVFIMVKWGRPVFRRWREGRKQPEFTVYDQSVTDGDPSSRDRYESFPRSLPTETTKKPRKPAKRSVSSKGELEESIM